MLDKFKKQLINQGEIYLRIKVRPGAKKFEVIGIMQDGAIKINVSAPPVKGKANEELVKFLTKEFNIENNKVKIIGGTKERLKLVKIIK